MSRRRLRRLAWEALQRRPAPSAVEAATAAAIDRAALLAAGIDAPELDAVAHAVLRAAAVSKGIDLEDARVVARMRADLADRLADAVGLP